MTQSVVLCLRLAQPSPSPLLYPWAGDGAPARGSADPAPGNARCCQQQDPIISVFFLRPRLENHRQGSGLYPSCHNTSLKLRRSRGR